MSPVPLIAMIVSGCGLTKVIHEGGTQGAIVACPEAEAEFALKIGDKLSACAGCHYDGGIGFQAFSLFEDDAETNRTVFLKEAGNDGQSFYDDISTHTGGQAVTDTYDASDFEDWLQVESECPTEEPASSDDEE